MSGATSRPKPTRPTATKPAAMSPRQLGPLDVLAGEAEQRGQQRERGEHGDATVTAALTARPCTKPMPMSSMPSSEITTVSAGEQHRAAGGVHGDLDRLPHVVARVELLAVPRDDQQRVVDADAEADHDPDERGELGDRR